MKKLIFAFFVLVFSCSEDQGNTNTVQRQKNPALYGNYYEIFVGSFYDSDGDGMGDLKGITEKLDYLNDAKPDSNTSLHVDGLWLMPIMPSDTYHKYDVRDYCAIDSAYGTMADFEELIAECNKRNIGLIIDLVMNHTSNKHEWFVRAKSGESAYQKYYNVSATKLNNTYYALGATGKYYEGIFGSNMPDLNFDNPSVKKEFQKIVDFWLDKGVAGFRLDAIMHVYNDHAKSIKFVKWFTDYCISRNPDVYIVGEVWSSGAEIVNFYGSGIPSLFNFPFANNQIIASAVKNGSSFVNPLVKWETMISDKSPWAIDAPFLSNHDSDRSAGHFNGNLVQEKLAAAVYLFMPGNPFIYYGEEIGTEGSGIDENKRGPLVWSKTDKTGLTKGPPNMTYSWNAPAGGVAEQLGDPDSLLNFYIDAIKLKKKYPLLFGGTVSAIVEDAGLAAYRVQDGAAALAVVHNLSGTTQTLALDGAVTIGGTLKTGSELPSLDGVVLTMPAYTTALVEF